MAIILNIDTALKTASVCLSSDEKPIKTEINENQNDHASWLHSAISKLLKESGFQMNALEAVAVSIGPGSYTGLRIGLSAAKGLCYALNIPLITVSTLKMMASAIKDEAEDLICPMIDARRMEVFTAVYDQSLNEIVPPSAMIIDKESFSELLQSHRILFCGDGHQKLQTLVCHPNAIFSTVIGHAVNLPHFAYNYFLQKRFADLAYTEPLYIKQFYTPSRKGH
jgi:tRNA threonylcarbamoyladenosine biosynthesis protein TsaB